MPRQVLYGHMRVAEEPLQGTLPKDAVGARSMEKQVYGLECLPG